VGVGVAFAQREQDNVIILLPIGGGECLQLLEQGASGAPVTALFQQVRLLRFATNIRDLRYAPPPIRLSNSSKESETGFALV
jgi:hypothetical protein